MRLPSLAAAIVGLGALLAATAGAHAERLTDRPLVDAAWLSEHLGNPNLVIIDSRDAANGVLPYATAHIPGAISAPYSAAGWREEIDGVPAQFPGEEKAAALIGGLGISNDHHVVIVPQGTDSSEFGGATRIYWTFKVLGHDAVSILDGGARAWEAANGAVTAEPTVLAPTTFATSFRQHLLATTADVEAALAAGGIPLIDGRPSPQYRGEAKSGVVRVPGTIPGAVNIENASFYDAANARFADAETIAAIAAGVGVGPDQANIAFCNTGHWASIIWFGLSEVQGNANTRMYDGSMAEWAADPARPIQ